jgi:hypothetical protein
VILGKANGILALFGALVNPAMLCYAAAWLARSRGAARPLLAAAAIVGIVTSAIYIQQEHLTTYYYGFFAWSAGILIVLSGELLEAVSGRLASQNRTTTY